MKNITLTHFLFTLALNVRYQHIVLLQHTILTILFKSFVFFYMGICEFTASSNVGHLLTHYFFVQTDVKLGFKDKNEVISWNWAYFTTVWQQKLLLLLMNTVLSVLSERYILTHLHLDKPKHDLISHSLLPSGNVLDFITAWNQFSLEFQVHIWNAATCKCLM